MSEPHSFEFELRLRPVPGNWSTPAVQRLRIALKVLLRAFGLRAVECRPVLLAPAQPQDVPQAIQRTSRPSVAQQVAVDQAPPPPPKASGPVKSEKVGGAVAALPKLRPVASTDTGTPAACVPPSGESAVRARLGRAASTQLNPARAATGAST